MSIIHALLTWALYLLAPCARRRRTAPAPYPRAPALPLVRPSHVTSERRHVRLRRRLALVLAADFGIDLDRHVVGAAGWTA
ncbi:hypothetical protein [Streptomyces sp. NRRL F-5193]|uniref:hypothetical protein n=1 Tax=Streptomyces sp. NRRL F-5193 TaxID=1463860 RepID=UPI0005B7F7BE|nr:hypothetical protein [Streptomyces sp. NRRL F-5193]